MVNRKTTTNFSENENFVVFEAVIRLLELGYLPKNIELELKLSLGRGVDKLTGWSDIVVFNNAHKAFMVVECKTPGPEFEKHWRKTRYDGYQLLSYVYQLKHEGTFPNGVLYTCDMDSLGNIAQQYHIISFTDNPELIKDKKNKLPLFKNANNASELFSAWKNTYGLASKSFGIFDDDSKIYSVGYRRPTAADISGKKLDTNGLINKFRSILRQHNISGGENAFDRLVNLFLAKIVDETQSRISGRPLDFYWDGLAYDQKKMLLDRLQRLYRDGMRDYLHEDVTYIEDRDIDDAFQLFKNDKDATRDKIHEYFDELKYYSDNFFSFIDVYNEKLFNTNFKVLSEIVSLFQDVSLTDTKQEQFLGDLFERLLDQGIKQSEGQFFTPLPIVRFLISSLPLKALINNDSSVKMIDYACGAGHFLTEYATQIRGLEDDSVNRKVALDSIYGIEKESRLAKVSKVSTLMYGIKRANIFYHDALSEIDEIKPESFSILVSNPPYSVKGFLRTISDETRSKYRLNKFVSDPDKNANIELFFVERAAQIMKPGGVVAIILPTSILHREEAIFVEARKIIFETFEVIAIFKSGTGTFAKTGTETVTFFLKKRVSHINLIDHICNRVMQWSMADYSKDDVFEDHQYLTDFAKLLKMSEEDVLVDSNLQESLEYYILVRMQKVSTLVIEAPSSSRSQKEFKSFLGYTWSTRKGSEGIQYVNSSNPRKKLDAGHIQTPLFNPSDLGDQSKINTMIRNNFLNKEDKEVENSEFVDSIRLESLIDWKNQKFVIDLGKRNTARAFEVQSGERAVNLGDTEEFTIGIGKRWIQALTDDKGAVSIYSANVTKPFGYTNEEFFDDYSNPTIIWGIDGNWQVGLIPANVKFYPTDHIGYLIIKDHDIVPEYLQAKLRKVGEALGFGRANRASMARIKKITIGIPSLGKQRDYLRHPDNFSM